ncbi:FHA domain-containing protein [Pseudarthrobacter sp902506025]|uniref:FHA domain-containing protein n=1 Tax=Pseudarthrobacter sp. 902506025 TaxID=3155291 RepID=UPI0034507A7B
MTGASYIPGTWLGIVRSGTAVLLGPETPAGLAGAIWELLASQPEPHEVLAAVTSSSGGSLTRIPSFGILDFNGSLRVFLRGDLDLTVEQPGGPVELDGRDVTTWNERRFVVAGTCRLGIAGGATAGLAAERRGQPLGEQLLGEQPLPELRLAELPLGEGVVLLQSLTLCAPAGPAAVGGPAAVDREESPRTPASVDAPFAVSSSGEVDGPAGFDQALTPEAPAGGGETADDSPVGTPSGIPAATAGGPQQPDALPDPEPAVRHLDPEATIAPGAIIDADGELLDETGAEDPTGPGEQGPELPGSGTTGTEPTAPAPGHADSAPAVEMTTSYDHLWDRTVMRNIEDAAVREDPDADSGHVVPQQQPALPAAEPLPALGTGEDAATGGSSAESGAGPAGAADAGPADTRSDAPAGHGDGSNGTAATPSRPASSGVLIDSVPWRTAGTAPSPTEPGTGSDAPAREPASFQGPPAAYEPGPAAFGPAPVHELPADGPPAHNPQVHNPQAHIPQVQQPDTGQEPGAGFDPDHDGQTVMKSSVAGSTAGPATDAPAARQDAGGGPLVLARVCAQGHANPPTRAQCSVCGAALLPDAVQVARPRLGRMRLSTGDLLDLDQSMVIGRQPSVSRVQGGVMPRLVQVASPGGDISRSHVEVRLEGWHVMLCDLKATNGTVLVREGQPPRRLAQNEMAILLDGDIAELGDNISLRFEEIP